MLIGCKDGYLRKVDSSTATGQTDDGNNINSFVDIGPLTIGKGSGQQIIVSDVDANMGIGSGAATLDIYGADAAEKLDTATVRVSRSVSAGRNRRFTQRVAANAIKFRIGSNTTTSWSLEGITVAADSLALSRRGRV
jgi:hypothetical protein